MKRLKHDVLLRVVKLINPIIITIPFAICWLQYYASCISETPYYEMENYLVILLFFTIYVIYGRIYEGFLISVNRISEMIYSQILAIIIADVMLYFVTILLRKDLPNIFPIFLTFICQMFFAVMWSYFANWWYFRTFSTQKTVIVYDIRRGMWDLINEYGLDKKFSVEKTFSVEECLVGGLDKLDGMDVVFLCGVHSHDRNIILKYCIAHEITVYMLPRIGDVIMSSAKQVHLFHLPMMRVDRYNPSPQYLFFKRLFDMISSAIVIVVTSPIMIITAAAIKATDGGPVFYKQCRLTKDGKEFHVLKFRSMRVDAEKDGVARLSTGKNDDRITPIGHFIRKVRIDELPQLFNILGGSMSVVGPRPERPEIALQYEKELPEFALRLQAKAGLTGYAQVYGKYNTTPYDKLQMDLMYIAQPSFLEDLRIIFATIKILFIPESTEGVAEGQATAMDALGKQMESYNAKKEVAMTAAENERELDGYVGK